MLIAIQGGKMATVECATKAHGRCKDVDCGCHCHRRPMNECDCGHPVTMHTTFRGCEFWAEDLIKCPCEKTDARPARLALVRIEKRITNEDN